jgi:hypothetical protein
MASKAIKFGPVHAISTYAIRIRGEHGCTMTNRRDMVAGQVDCYLASQPGRVVDVFYGECCALCGGQGKISKRSRRVMFAHKPCPRCAGTGGVVADVLLETFAAAAVLA